MFERCKDLLKESYDFVSKVERFTKEKEELNAIVSESAKEIVDL